MSGAAKCVMIAIPGSALHGVSFDWSLLHMMVLMCNLDCSNVDLETGKSEAYGLPIPVCAVTHCCLFSALFAYRSEGARLDPVTRVNNEFSIPVRFSRWCNG